MPDNVSSTLFSLPEGRQVEVFLVRLDDGTLVARTRDELEALPAELRPEIVGEVA